MMVRALANPATLSAEHAQEALLIAPHAYLIQSCLSSTNLDASLNAPTTT